MPRANTFTAIAPCSGLRLLLDTTAHVLYNLQQML